MSGLSRLRLPWGSMAFEDSGGEGPVLLLLHGTGCDRFDWQPMLAHIPPAVRTVRPEFRGHGASDDSAGDFTISDLADDICALLDTLDATGVCLAGHSLGGMAGMLVAERSPRMAGLVLLEGWTTLTCAGTAFAPGRFFGALSPETVAEVKRKSEATRARCSRERWTRFWTSVERFNGRAFLGATALPVMEVYGELGRTPDSVRRLGAPDRPNIAWRWIAGAGHYLPLDQPAATAAACLDMIHSLGSDITRSRLSPPTDRSPAQ